MDVSSSAVHPAAARSPDPYALSADAIEAPPASIPSALRRIGPGIVLAASIVGSGEVIATTTLGAQVGFAALWIVLASCAIKPVVQGEFGRYTIATGQTGLEGFNRVPGPRAGVNWLVWAWALTVASTLMQVGGMYGGVAQVLHLLAPLSVNAWVGVCLAITLAMLLGGGYQRIERFAIVKVGLFTLLTVCAAAVLLRRPGAVDLSDLASGLSFGLPPAGLVTAIAVFGITGVGATELVMYPVLVHRKRVRPVRRAARSIGRMGRARSWVDTRHARGHPLLARGLHPGDRGILPSGRRRAASHRRRAGEPRYHRRSVSDLHANAGRLGAVGLLRRRGGHVVRDDLRRDRRARAPVRRRRPNHGLYAREDADSRRRWRDRFVVALAAIPALLYWLFESPVRMVVVGGIAQALMLPLIGLGVTYLRHTHVPEEIQPSVAITVLLWLSTAVMFAFAIYSGWSALRA